jgi:DNA-binding transcriptional ArsR family regulator
MIHKEIELRLPLAGSTVSQHLDRLEDVGMVEKAVIAGIVVYRLNNQGLQGAKQQLETYLARVA